MGSGWGTPLGPGGEPEVKTGSGQPIARRHAPAAAGDRSLGTALSLMSVSMGLRPRAAGPPAPVVLTGVAVSSPTAHLTLPHRGWTFWWTVQCHSQAGRLRAGPSARVLPLSPRAHGSRSVGLQAPVTGAGHLITACAHSAPPHALPGTPTGLVATAQCCASGLARTFVREVSGVPLSPPHTLPTLGAQQVV